MLTLLLQSPDKSGKSKPYGPYAPKELDQV